MDRDFRKLYAHEGRPSIPPEQLLSDEHFSVDGTLIEAWASHKSFITSAEDKAYDTRGHISDLRASKYHAARRAEHQLQGRFGH